MPSKLAANHDAACFLVQAELSSPPKDCEQMGWRSSKPSPSIWWIATASTKSRNGISKSGMSRISISGAAIPRQETYLELYDHTARAIKNVNPKLRVGGPATAQAAWVDAFIPHCTDNKIPLDFVSTHVYGNDTCAGRIRNATRTSRATRWCAAQSRKCTTRSKPRARPNSAADLERVQRQLQERAGRHRFDFMGPWMADTIRQCDGLVDIMSYWTFSDVFEEQGVVKTPFYGGYGLIAEDDIPKPAFNAFKTLASAWGRANSARLRLRSAYPAKRWNVSAGAMELRSARQSGSSKTITVRVKNSNAKHAYISRVDADHGDVHEVYGKNGTPTISHAETDSGTPRGPRNFLHRRVDLNRAWRRIQDQSRGRSSRTLQ